MTSACNKKALSTMVHFLEALAFCSQTPGLLASDAMVLLRICKLDTTPLQNLKDSIKLLSAFSTKGKFLVLSY